MDWSRSYTSDWRVYRVNEDTWQDGETVDGVDTVTVTRAADGALLEAGSMDTTGDVGRGLYRIVLVAEQDGEAVREDIATLYMETTGGVVDKGARTVRSEGYSVLYPAATALLRPGAYAPNGADGVVKAAELLRSAVQAPIDTTGSFQLARHVVFEQGSTVLSAVWTLLNIGGYTMQLDGRGIIHILPMPDEPSLELTGENICMLMPGVSYAGSAAGVPNTYTAVDGRSVTAINDDPTSPVSTVSRGFRVDVIDEEPVLVRGEGLEGYAERRLEELSAIQETRDYTREYTPGATVYGIVRASIDGMQGDYRITRQSLACSHGVTVAEQAVKEVKLWTRRTSGR